VLQRIKEAFLCLDLHALPEELDRQDPVRLNDIWQLMRARADKQARPDGKGIVGSGQHYPLHEC
jgi:hypothetical protein